MLGDLWGGIWDRGAAAGVGSENQNTRHIIMNTGKIVKFGWSTVSGDATTQYKISINGSVTNFIPGVAAATGLVAIGPYSVTTGDRVSIGYSNVGTIPSNSAFYVSITT